MKLLKKLVSVSAMLLLVALVTSTLAAQQEGDANREAKGGAKATTMTGCLSKDSSGNFVLTDESTGVKTTVTGPADLEKHSANHKVKLTGSTKADTAGKSMFEVTKIQHVSETCSAK